MLLCDMRTKKVLCTIVNIVVVCCQRSICSFFCYVQRLLLLLTGLLDLYLLDVLYEALFWVRDNTTNLRVIL